MENDDSRLIERLRSIDRRKAFDAERVAESIIAERIRRRRRSVVGGFMAAAVLISVIVWRGSQDNDSSIAGNNETRFLDTSNDSELTEISPSDTDADEIASSTFADYDWQVQDLLDRIDKAKSTIAARQLENERQLFAVYRAHASANLTLSEIVDLD